MRLSDFRYMLCSALNLLGDGPGRVEISDGSRRVRVGRSSADRDEPQAGEPVNPLRTAGPSAALAVPAGVIVRAPAVGIVSFRDQRTDKPFAVIGQTVTQGETLAFITSMEITTKVVSPRAGVVEEVFVEDGDGVEYNAPLLKILPSA